MRRRERDTAGATVRLAMAVLFVASLVVWLPGTSTAAPSHHDLEAAKAKLRTLVQQQGALVEQYDRAQAQLQQVTAELAQAQSDMARERAAARAAQSQADQAAAAAYENSGSELSAILGATSLSQLTDRVQFLQTIARRRQDEATAATVATQLARAAAQRYAQARTKQQQLVQTLNDRRKQIEASIGQQRQLVNKITREIAKAQKIAREKARAAALAAAAPPVGTGPVPPTGPPPPPGSGAAIAIAAAKSQLGVPYVWGASDPGVGFDCSGLTMWAWGRAGVSMPHFAASQYAMFPHVPRDQLQPGDLVFFYWPIDHVGIYVGNGEMIDAPYTGTVVRYDPVYWSVYSGAARP